MTTRQFMAVTKALADENRIRILLALEEQELCVCQITELMGLAPSTTSKHLSILYQAGLLNSRKEGRWMYYALPGKEAPIPKREAIRWVTNTLSQEPRFTQDAAVLQKILNMDPTELCKRQCQS